MSRKMKDSGLEWAGQIPFDWNLKRLQWCLEEINNKNDPVQTTRVLSLTNKLGVVPYEEKGNQGNKAKENYAEYKLAYENTLIVNSMNVIIGSVGISNYFGCVSPVYYVFKATPNADLRYINYIFNTTGFQKELRKYANGILEIRLRISASNLLKRPIPLPSLAEQSRISDYLDKQCEELDKLITKTAESIDEYKRLKQALVIQTVTKGLSNNRKFKPCKIEWIDTIPDEWEECRIKNVVFPQQKPVCEEDEIITCFRDGTVTLRKNRREDGFTVSFTENGYQGVDVGDLVIHGMDAFAGAIGCSDSKGKTTPVVHVCKTSGDNRYFMYYLRSLAYGNILMDLSNGVRIRSSDFRNFAKLGVFGALVPPIEEQKEISDFLDEKCAAMDVLIAKKEAYLAELENYKKALIYEYVTGKKEVPWDN